MTTDLDPTSLVPAGQRVIGSTMGAGRIASDIAELILLYRGGKLKLDELASGRYALSASNEAIADPRHGTALRQVIVF